VRLRRLVLLLSIVLALSASGQKATLAAGSVAAGERLQSIRQLEQAASPEDRASAYMDSVRNNPLLLRAFLLGMPKGGDLHNHLAGAVYAEDFIDIAARNGLCVDVMTFVLQKPPCSAADGTPAVADTLTNSAIYNGMIDAWSMRGAEASGESGHDHFFNTFAKFSLASSLETGHQVALVTSHASMQNVLYLELMHTVDGSAAANLGSQVGWESDLADLRSKLIAAGMTQVATAAGASLDRADAEFRSELQCDTPNADPGCSVGVRYLYQVIRTQPPERVFAQFVLGFMLAQSDPRVVGINLVAPEDDYTALRDYTLQMSMLDYLHSLYPNVNIALHAGELAPGLVSPPNLRFHIWQAIELGHAQRIGHGTDVTEEDNPFDLLDAMRQRGILVEISLYSSRGILGVEGSNHPFPIYLAEGVPVALATDDEGVSRSDLTAEYTLAAETFGLSYSELKRISRNSLEYSFLPGSSLWLDGDESDIAPACAGDRPVVTDVSTACQHLLDSSEKAAMEWRLEQAFSEFEAGY
jgi:adenosine deaminase